MYSCLNSESGASKIKFAPSDNKDNGPCINVAEENNYATSVKDYKNDPDNYKGHIGDICEMIRHVVTGKNQTPNLSNILSILGKESIEKRINFFEL